MHRDQKSDAAEIRRALELLTEPGDVVELRALLRPRGAAVGYYTDREALVRDACHWSGRASGVYVMIDPVNPALLGRAANRCATGIAGTGDGDVLRRRWLKVDFDPVRPTGVSATDQEREAALAAAREGRAWLREAGFPEPLFADTGNGARLLYRLGLPNDPASGQLVNRALAALASRFDSGAVTVDQATGNAARIEKLYGTLAAKGDPLPDRPHRIARILEVPEAVEVCPVERLQEVAQVFQPANPSISEPAGWKACATLDLDRWIAEHPLPVASAGPWNGGRKWVLNPCPWNEQHTNGSAFVVQHASGAIAAGCHHNSCRDYDWHSLRDLLEPGWRARRSEPSCPASNSNSKCNSNSNSNSIRCSDLPSSSSSSSSSSSTSSSTSSSSMPILSARALQAMDLPPPRAVIEGILVEGAALLAGRPKLGKTWLALQFAVEIARGGKMFGDLPVEEGDALYLGLEDGPRRMKKRLSMVLGNIPWPERLSIAPQWPTMDQGGLDPLEAWLRAHPGARLVVIDTLEKVRPARGSSGSVYGDDYAAIAVFKDLADRYEVPLLVVHHLRKGGADDPVETVSGSFGLTGAVDGILVLQRPRSDPRGKLFVTGRDVEEQELAILFEQETGIWRRDPVPREPDLPETTEARQQVLDLLRDLGEPVTPTEAAALLGKPLATVKTLLWRMAQAGEVRRWGNGKYSRREEPEAQEDPP